MVNDDMSDFDSSLVGSDQSSMQEQCPVTQTPQPSSRLFIEEPAAFMDPVAGKIGVHMAT